MIPIGELLNSTIWPHMLIVSLRSGTKKQDLLTGHEHSRQALEHSQQAHQMSLQAHEGATANDPNNAPADDATK
jgi:hypothetical protein